MQALSTTATRLVFEPVIYIADSCGRSLNAFLQHVPAVWQPAMVVVITASLLLCVLLLSKSRIKFGFFEIGAADTDVRKIGREEIIALRNCIRDEVRDVIRCQENIEELPRIGSAVQEERARHRYISSAEAKECSE